MLTPPPDQPARGRPRDPGRGAAILQATRELLDEGAIETLTIDSVARRAGVGKPTIYRRWPSKAALVCDALAGAVGAPPTPDTGTLAGDVAEMCTSIDGAVAALTTAGTLAEVLRPLLASPELADRFQAAHLAPLEEAFIPIFTRAHARGELPVAADGGQLVRMADAVILYHRMVQNREWGDTDQRWLVRWIIDEAEAPHLAALRRAGADEC